MSRDPVSAEAALRESANRSVRAVLLCVFLLLAAGWVMLLDSGLVFEGQANPDNFAHLIRARLLGTTVGAVLLLGLWAIPARWVRSLSFPAMIAGIALLALVWSPIGVAERGSMRWEQLGPFRFQPLEFAKLALVWFLADQFARIGSLDKAAPNRLLFPGLAVVIAIALVGGQPNLSGALFLIVLTLAMAWIGGINGRFTLMMALSGGAAFAGLLALNPDRLQRFLPVFRPLTDLGGAGYQVGLSLWAVTNGGLFGQGPGGSIAMYSLPDHANDFIFSIISEEWGFVGGIIIILLFAALVYCGFRLALMQNDPFRILLGCGISSIIGLQAAINIGVTLGLLPTTGMPLPFLSAGGSNLILSFMEIGLILNLGQTVGARAEQSTRVGTPAKTDSPPVRKTPSRPATPGVRNRAIGDSIQRRRNNASAAERYVNRFRPQSSRRIGAHHLRRVDRSRALGPAKDSVSRTQKRVAR